jgi:hypothetical protein
MKKKIAALAFAGASLGLIATAPGRNVSRGMRQLLMRIG